MHRVKVLIKDTEWEVVSARRTVIGAVDWDRVSATFSVKSPEFR